MVYGLINDKLIAKIKTIFEIRKLIRKNRPKYIRIQTKPAKTERHKIKKPCNPEGLQGHPIVGVDGFEPPTLCL